MCLLLQNSIRKRVTQIACSHISILDTSRYLFAVNVMLRLLFSAGICVSTRYDMGMDTRYGMDTAIFNRIRQPRKHRLSRWGKRIIRVSISAVDRGGRTVYAVISIDLSLRWRWTVQKKFIGWIVNEKVK